MNEHLAAWQIAEFIMGGLDDDELGTLTSAVSAWAGWPALFGSRLISESRAPERGSGVAGTRDSQHRGISPLRGAPCAPARRAGPCR